MVRQARDAETLEKNMVAKPWMYAHAKNVAEVFYGQRDESRRKFARFFFGRNCEDVLSRFLGCSSQPRASFAAKEE